MKPFPRFYFYLCVKMNEKYYEKSTEFFFLLKNTFGHFTFSDVSVPGEAEMSDEKK